ncbi:hypothetical protein [Mogibacterium diversum]
MFVLSLHYCYQKCQNNSSCSSENYL